MTRHRATPREIEALRLECVAILDASDDGMTLAAIRDELGCTHMTARRILCRNVELGLIVRQGQPHGRGVTWRGLRRIALCRSVFELAGAMTVEYAGSRMTLAEAAQMAGMDYQTVIDRMMAGLSIDAALIDNIGPKF